MEGSRNEHDDDTLHTRDYSLYSELTETSYTQTSAADVSYIFGDADLDDLTAKKGGDGGDFDDSGVIQPGSVSSSATRRSSRRSLRRKSAASRRREALSDNKPKKKPPLALYCSPKLSASSSKLSTRKKKIRAATVPVPAPPPFSFPPTLLDAPQASDDDDDDILFDTKPSGSTKEKPKTGKDDETSSIPEHISLQDKKQKASPKDDQDSDSDDEEEQIDYLLPPADEIPPAEQEENSQRESMEKSTLSCSIDDEENQIFSEILQNAYKSSIPPTPIREESPQNTPEKVYKRSTPPSSSDEENQKSRESDNSTPPSTARSTKQQKRSSVHARHIVLREKIRTKRQYEDCKTCWKTIFVGFLLFALSGLTLTLALYLGGFIELNFVMSKDEKFIQILPQYAIDAIQNDANSPQSRAYAWIEQDKLVNAGLSNTRQIRRFALATFYFATSGEEWGDRHHNAAWLRHDLHECGWDVEHIVCFQMASNSRCRWEGNTEAACRLAGVSIRHGGLEGTLPLEIGMLTDLLSLELSDNSFSGALPTTIGDLRELRTLDLNKNAFTGRILTEIGKLNHLVKLDLSENHFDGTLPEHIGRLSHNLVELQIQNNNLSGISDEIGELLQLELLNLSNNKLGGPIPTVIGRLSNLHSFSAGNCGFTGTIPTEVLNISTAFVSLRLPNNYLNGTSNFIGDIPDHAIYDHLEYLDLSHNHFNGPIPADNYHLFPKIKYMILDANHFTGTIHPDVGHLTTLEALSFSRNRLTGTIPTTLSQLTLLRELVLDSNNDALLGEAYYENENIFEGSIPDEICQLTNKVEDAGLEIRVDCQEVTCNCSCVCIQVGEADGKN